MATLISLRDIISQRFFLIVHKFSKDFNNSCKIDNYSVSFKKKVSYGKDYRRADIREASPQREL